MAFGYWFTKAVHAENLLVLRTDHNSSETFEVCDVAYAVNKVLGFVVDFWLRQRVGGNAGYRKPSFSRSSNRRLRFSKSKTRSDELKSLLAAAGCHDWRVRPVVVSSGARLPGAGMSIVFATVLATPLYLSRSDPRTIVQSLTE